MSVTLERMPAPVVRRETAPAPHRTRTRDPFFDNAKFLLVTAVVVGHSWVMLPDSALTEVAYDYLYLFHMPAFVLVTGYLSRSFTWSSRSLSRLVTTVLVPYLVFEGLLALFHVHVGGRELDNLWLDPHWAMWFLVALAGWRLATPLIRTAPAPLLLAVGVCLLGGLTSGDVLDTARLMGFLPFYVLGVLARPEHVARLRSPGVRVASGLVLVVTAALSPWLSARIPQEWLYWRSSYSELGVGLLEGAAGRLGLLALSTVLALSVLSLMPTSARWFTRLGAASLVVYLCHGFAVKGAEYGGLGSLFEGRPLTGLLVTSSLAVALAVLLAAPPVARRLDVLVNPVGRLLGRTGGRRAANDG